MLLHLCSRFHVKNIHFQIPVNAPNYILYIIQVCGHLTSALISRASPKCGHKLGNMQMYFVQFYAVVLQFSFSGTKRPKPDPVRQCPCAQSQLNEDHG